MYWVPVPEKQSRMIGILTFDTYDKYAYYLCIFATLKRIAKKEKEIKLWRHRFVEFRWRLAHPSIVGNMRLYFVLFSSISAMLTTITTASRSHSFGRILSITWVCNPIKDEIIYIYIYTILYGAICKLPRVDWVRKKRVSIFTDEGQKVRK